MLPHDDHEPSHRTQPFFGLVIPLGIAGQLRSPELGICLRRRQPAGRAQSEVGVACVLSVDLSGISRYARGRTVAAEVALEAPLRLVALHTIDHKQAGDIQILDLVEARGPRVLVIDASPRRRHPPAARSIPVHQGVR